MRVVGVICEYNPFHKGHAYHLARARELTGADFVVCAMSGSVTQRGVFARHDKWTRARMALACGADLVLELPARFACASAQEFAGGGVSLLAALGVNNGKAAVEQAARTFCKDPLSVRASSGHRGKHILRIGNRQVHHTGNCTHIHPFPFVIHSIFPAEFCAYFDSAPDKI
jgi:hypothetical protein